MFRSSLSRRLFFLMLASMLPLAAILFYNLYILLAAKEREVHAEALRVGQQAALELQRIIGGVEDTLVAISTVPAVQDFDPDLCNEYMLRVSRKLPQFAGIAVIDKDGIIRCRQNPTGLGVSLADKPYVQETLRNASIAVGYFTKGRVSGELVLPISVPIQDNGGPVTGAVAGSVSLKWLERRISERIFAKNSALTVADRDGVILARYPLPEKFIGTRIPSQYQYLVQAQQPGTIELTSQDGYKRVLAYFPPAYTQSGLYVSLGLSTEEEYGTLRSALIFGIVVTFAAIVIALLLATITARYAIRRPVDRLVKTVQAWRKNDETARSRLTPASGEFGIISSAIDAYMDELVASRAQRQRDEQQRELLIGELDHRVKNLLATVQAVARQTFRGSNLDPGVLDAFNSRLAAMAQAHAVVIRNDWQSANLFDAVRAAILPFDNPDSSRFEISGPALMVQSKAALAFSMALHELCTNAAKYGALSREEGMVIIDWNVDISQHGEQLVMHWIERGGPEVRSPERKGFGSLMIEKMLGNQITGEVTTEYAAEGLRCTVVADLANVKVVS